MIASVPNAVASAISVRANADGYTQSLTCEAAYLPVDDLAAMDGLHVFVVPSSLSDDLATRGSEQMEYAVDVVVSKKLGAADRTSPQWHNEMGVLLDVVEEISNGLRFQDMAGCTWAGAQVAPLYDPRRLKETNVFLSVIRVTYWMVG